MLIFTPYTRRLIAQCVYFQFLQAQEEEDSDEEE